MSYDEIFLEAFCATCPPCRAGKHLRCYGSPCECGCL